MMAHFEINNNDIAYEADVIKCRTYVIYSRPTSINICLCSMYVVRGTTRLHIIFRKCHCVTLFRNPILRFEYYIRIYRLRWFNMNPLVYVRVSFLREGDINNFIFFFKNDFIFYICHSFL